MEVVLVGGSYDGQRYKAENGYTEIRLPVLNPMASIERPFEAIEHDWEKYRAMEFAGDHQYFVVFALEGLTPDDVLQALIANYNLDN